MVNKTMQLFRNLSRPGHRDQFPCPSPAARQCWSSIESRHLLNDASGGRGFGCAAGWVDPDKCTKEHPPGKDGLEPRCMAVFWTGGPSRAKSASQSLRRALLMPQVNPGSRYRCGRGT